MAYQRVADSNKADQNTKLLGDSLDGAVNGAITLYKNQVAARDAEDENNFQSLVANGTMSLADQLAYRKEQLARTTDTDTRATLRTAIGTLNAQVSQKNFSDSYTVQLQQNAAGIESIQSVVDWLQGQLAGATDQTVISKIQSELVTQQGNLFSVVQKTLSDQTNYAQKSGNLTTINNQITALQSAKGKALLAGDAGTAATLDLQIQSLQQFVAVNAITTTMQNMATSTVTGSASATDLLNSYNTQISSADNSTPITINGQTYASAHAFWAMTRDAYIADSGSSGFFARVTKEATDMVNVKASNNTLSSSDLSAINTQFAQLSSNPILAPFGAQLATAKQSALQSAADALAQVIENKYDQSLDLNTALNALQAIASQGVNVDSTTQKILNSAAQTQSQAVQSIMSAANTLMAGTPGMTITQAVTQAIASGAGAIIPNNDLLSKTPGATAIDQLGKDAAGKNTASGASTITQPSTAAIDYTLHQGETIDQYNTRISAARAAAASPSTPSTSAAPEGGAAATPAPKTATPAATAAPVITATAKPSSAATAQTSIDYTLHPGETIAQYNDRIASERAAISAANTSPAPTPAAPSTAPFSQPSVPPPSTFQSGQPTTPAPAPAATSSASAPAPVAPANSAAQILKSNDPYSPPTGLTQTRTNQGGTAYADKVGNLYVQSQPGVYTLNNSLK